jgi:hypothetical protein
MAECPVGFMAPNPPNGSSINNATSPAPAWTEAKMSKVGRKRLLSLNRIFFVSTAKVFYSHIPKSRKVTDPTFFNPFFDKRCRPMRYRLADATCPIFKKKIQGAVRI